jgi:HK97 gp10 family phage protein
MTTITLDGGKELAAALRNASKDMVAAVEEAVKNTGVELRSDVVKRIQRGPKTGIVYQRRGIRHPSSAPGQAPATDTGRLANSIIFEQVGPVSVTVGSALIYAAYLEYGTTRMAPRPAWRPAVEAMAPKFRSRLLRALGMALD